jgi:hypothetical protein
VPDPASPQSFNRYLYTLGNPLRFVDPTGMFTEEELVELGVYTWEEIEALRGTDWYSLLMDPDAQIGASIYFGNGLADYTGPMGMGTFYLSEGKLFVGGDVSLWNQDIGMYETRKGWASPVFWGDLFEQASHEPDSYGLVPGTGSEYSAINFSFAIPRLPSVIGGTVTYMQDKNGACYLSGGLAVGESATWVSLNWAEGQGPAPRSMEEFAKGWSLNVNAGTLLGGGYTHSFGTGEGVFEVGLYSPQIGASVQYGISCPCYVQLR